MGSPAFPKLRGPDGQASREQDNVSQQLQPVAVALARTPIMGAPPPGWLAPSLLNGFTNFGTVAGANYALAGFHRDALLYVRIKGRVTTAAGAATGLPIFVLPPGYRPKEWNRFPSSGGAGTFQALTVQSNGTVWPIVAIAPGDTVDLSITFLAEQ